MNDQRDLLERVGERFDLPEDVFGRLLLRRRRKLRNQRIGSAVVAVLVSLVAIGGLLRAFAGSERTGKPTPSSTPGFVPVASDVSFVNIRTGAVTPLPESITSIGGREISASLDGTQVAFSARDRSYVRQIFVANLDGSGIRQVTRGVVEGTEAHFPRWSPDGTRITFERASPFGVGFIAVVDLRTGASTQLTRGPAEAWRPSFHPNGTTILFTRQGDNVLDLWTIPSGGGRNTMLLSNAASGSLSPDGTTIAYYHTGKRHYATTDRYNTSYDPLSFADASGDIRHRPRSAGIFPPLLSLDASHFGPMWSPDGTQITYALDSAEPGPIFVRDQVTGERIQVGTGNRPSWLDDDTLIVEKYEADGSPGMTPSPSSVEPIATPADVSLVSVATGKATPVPKSVRSLPEARDFQASPHGSKIAFSARDRDNVVHLFTANIDGTALRKVTTYEGGYAFDPRWSPDGTKLVYTGCCGHSQVYILDTSTGRETQLTHGSAEVWYPTFSPDGRTVLFTMEWKTKLNLWTVPATGGKPVLLLEDAAFGSYSPDGKTIAFRRSTATPDPTCGRCWWIGHGISFVASDGTGVQRSSTDSTMAEMAYAPGSASWSPDGSRIAYRTGWGVSSPMVVVNVATGAITERGSCSAVTWVDDDTLLVEGYEAADG